MPIPFLPEIPQKPVGHDEPSPGHQPQGVAAHGMASSRQVRRVHAEFLSPPEIPNTFCSMFTKLRLNSGSVSYSAQGGRLAEDWVAGFVRAHTCAVKIEVLDVSNGPVNSQGLYQVQMSPPQPESRHSGSSGGPISSSERCRGCVKTEAQVHAAGSQEGPPVTFSLIRESASLRGESNKKAYYACIA